MNAPEVKPPVPPAPPLNRILPAGPMASLFSVLESHPGVGWTLKQAQTLRVVAHKGRLPHRDPALVGDRILSPGCVEADLFERQQAAILRVADLRALQQARPASETHHFEADELSIGEPVREWTAWRLPLVGEGHPEGWLLTLWLDRLITAQPEEQLRQTQRQLHAQQMLIAEIQAQASSASAAASAAGSTSGSAQGLMLPDAWNRQAEQFGQHLRREIDLSRREHRNLAVLLIEIDTQELGAAGIQTALALVARQLSTSVRAMDTVTQIGPARFGVLLSGAALTPAHARGEAVRRASDSQRILDGEADRNLRLSIGVAAYPHNARQPEDLMAAAESALREAIDGGGGRSVVARVALGDPPPP